MHTQKSKQNLFLPWTGIYNYGKHHISEQSLKQTILYKV